MFWNEVRKNDFSEELAEIKVGDTVVSEDKDIVDGVENFFRELLKEEETSEEEWTAFREKDKNRSEHSYARNIHRFDEVRNKCEKMNGIEFKRLIEKLASEFTVEEVKRLIKKLKLAKAVGKGQNSKLVNQIWW